MTKGFPNLIKPPPNICKSNHLRIKNTYSSTNLKVNKQNSPRLYNADKTLQPLT